MKVVQNYVLEVGDIFEGNGVGVDIPTSQVPGYLVSNMLISSNRYIMVDSLTDADGLVTICGEGRVECFDLETIEQHIRCGNLMYVGNVIKGNK